MISNPTIDDIFEFLDLGEIPTTNQTDDFQKIVTEGFSELKENNFGLARDVYKQLHDATKGFNFYLKDASYVAEKEPRRIHPGASSAPEPGSYRPEFPPRSGRSAR